MKILSSALFALMIVSAACGKKGNDGPANLPPANLKLQATVSTDNSGNVSFVATADHAVSFDYDFGNGIFQTAPDGKITYKYPASGNYTVNVIAKGSGGQTISQSTQITVAVGQSLVWADEFDAPGTPDPGKWGYDIGGGGWGNNELEYYTSRADNVIVSNGTLKIIAKKEAYSGSAYTSARLLTKNLFSFKYGKIEVKAKLPASAGTWPAIWMLGSNIDTAPWPACGEIDIMEQTGGDKTKTSGTMHYPTQVGPYGDGGSTSVSNATSDFHRYAAIWSAASIQLLVDDVVFYTLPITSVTPFNQKFFVILNVAVGGSLGGTVDPAFTSSQMEIDYVRIYQ